VLRIPVVVSAWNCVLAVVWLIPACMFAMSRVLPMDSALTIQILLFAVCGLVLAGASGVLLGQIVMRPVMRDLGGPPAGLPVPAVAPVRLKLVFAIPAITMAAAGLGVLLGADPGVDNGQLLDRTLLAMAGTLVVAGPVAVLLATSLLRPLDDLLQATRRVAADDFTTPVPELSADEYGVLARSFNEAMGGLAQRQRLAADNARLLEDVRASRARIVTASDVERRRIERNIHDGAQQRLLAVALELRMLEADAAGNGHDGLAARAAAVRDTLKLALDELRELARGLHPAILASDGLSPALEQLATRAPVPVELHVEAGRYPAAIEATAWFVACEALANVAKYAHATHVDVGVERRDGHLVMTITDDGIGGARPSAGSGLTGLGDRVAALEGQLVIESPEGGGTTVRAELPLRA
jgi:signal transduction histidine kinase